MSQIKYKFNPDKTFFISDPHFYHENIIKYCNRPFKDGEDQNVKLIELWNNKVPKDADIWLLGDFAHTGNIITITNLLTTLNGRKWQIYGNHDYQNRLDREVFAELFEWRGDVANITIPDPEYVTPVQFFMSHYPHMFWPKHHIHLHGHVHSGPVANSTEIVPFHALRYDVGVDNNNYIPVSYRELMQIINDQILISDADKSKKVQD